MTDEELIAWRKDVVTKMLTNGICIESIIPDVMVAENFVATGQYKTISAKKGSPIAKDWVSPPVVIESQGDQLQWFLSFGGYNPDESESIELTQDQCFWLLDKIMNIDPNLFCNAKAIYLTSKGVD